jgi:hypothetical protein
MTGGSERAEGGSKRRAGAPQGAGLLNRGARGGRRWAAPAAHNTRRSRGHKCVCAPPPSPAAGPPRAAPVLGGRGSAPTRCQAALDRTRNPSQGPCLALCAPRPRGGRPLRPKEEPGEGEVGARGTKGDRGKREGWDLKGGPGKESGGGGGRGGGKGNERGGVKGGWRD